MEMFIILLLVVGSAGVYLYCKAKEEERREAERQANRKPCARCGRIHYNKGNCCTQCCIELFKQQKGRQ